MDEDSKATVHDLAVALGARGGAKGGHARAAALSPERRSEISRQAATARWSADAPLLARARRAVRAREAIHAVLRGLPADEQMMVLAEAIVKLELEG